MRIHPLTILTQGPVPESDGWIAPLVEALNGYFLEGERRFAFVEHRRVSQPDFSLDELDGPVPHGEYPCEIRLKTDATRRYASALLAANGAMIANLGGDEIPESPYHPRWRDFTQTIMHEFSHVFGAGLTEYYALSWMPDPTGVEPITPINCFAPGDLFFQSHADWLHDVLFRYTDQPKMSELTRRIVLGDFLFGHRAVPIKTDLSVEVIDEHRAPVNAHIRVWTITRKDMNNPETGGEARLVYDGLMEFLERDSFAASFSLGTDVDNVPNDRAWLIKAHAEGYVPLAIWVSFFDFQLASLNGDPQKVTLMTRKIVALPTSPIEHAPFTLTCRKLGPAFYVEASPTMPGEDYALESSYDGVNWKPKLTQTATGSTLVFGVGMTWPVRIRPDGMLSFAEGFRVRWVNEIKPPAILAGLPPLPVQV